MKGLDEAPSVSVVLPVHNGAATVAEAVTSVLEQSLQELELIVVDDASTDATLEILRAVDDPRLRVVADGKRRGLVGSLDHGIEIAMSDVIARMDDDCIAHRDRLAVELEALTSRPDIGLVASGYIVLDDEMPEPAFVDVPTSHATTWFDLLFRNCLGHSTVMFRRDVFRAVGGYAEDRFLAEDYDLWLRMAEVSRIETIPSAQVSHRVSASGLSGTNKHAQDEKARAVSAEALERVTGSRPADRVVGGLTGFGSPLGPSDFTEACAVVLAAYRGVARSCRTRGISTRGLAARLPRIIVRCGLRKRARLSPQQMTWLLARHPVVSAQLVSGRLRRIREL